MVIDAGGLGALSLDTGVLDPNLLAQMESSLILTPHPGEMARLTRSTVPQIQRRRWEIATEKAREWGSIVVLKGAHTAIAFPDGELFINPTGNSALATAGSGDVLTGMITGLLAQGLTPQQATLAGVYLHGLAGDLLAAGEGERGHVAGEALAYIPKAMNMAAEFRLGVEPGELCPLRSLNGKNSDN